MKNPCINQQLFLMRGREVLIFAHTHIYKYIFLHFTPLTLWSAKPHIFTFVLTDYFMGSPKLRFSNFFFKPLPPFVEPPLHVNTFSASVSHHHWTFLFLMHCSNKPVDKWAEFLFFFSGQRKIIVEFLFSSLNTTGWILDNQWQACPLLGHPTTSQHTVPVFVTCEDYLW